MTQKPTYLIAHGSKAVQAARIIAAVAEAKKCPKCGAVIGDDWRQCASECPMPGSPHYRPTVAPQQCGDEKLLMNIAILMHNWRCGRYKGDYVLSRLSQMFPSTPSAVKR